MKLLLAILLLSAPVAAQFTTTARHIAPVTSLPATCKVATGDVVYLTTGTKGVYQCGPTDNNWTAAGGSGSGNTTTSSGTAARAGVACTDVTLRYVKTDDTPITNWTCDGTLWRQVQATDPTQPANIVLSNPLTGSSTITFGLDAGDTISATMKLKPPMAACTAGQVWAFPTPIGSSPFQLVCASAGGGSSNPYDWIVWDMITGSPYGGGPDGWAADTSASHNHANNTAAGHPGIWTINTTAASGQFDGIWARWGYYGPLVDAGDSFTVDFLVQPVAFTSTSTIMLELNGTDRDSVTPADGLAVKKTSGNWQSYCSGGGVAETPTTIVAVANSWVAFRIKKVSGTVTFYTAATLNGLDAASAAVTCSTHVPTTGTGLNLGIKIWNNAATVDETMYIDLIRFAPANGANR